MSAPGSASTTEQLELRRTVRAFFTKHAPVGTHRGHPRSPNTGSLGADPADMVWDRLSSELGLTALPVAEDHGGAGASFPELAVVLEETGRVLLGAPYLSTTVAALVLADAGAVDLLPSLADGSSRAALALDATVTAAGGRLTGEAAQVLDGAGADVLLVAADDGLYAVEAGATGVRTTALSTLDATRTQARLELTSAPARRIGDVDATSHAVDMLHVGLAAESVGAAQRCLEMTVEHLLAREQFGRPLGSFQALRHRVADLTVLAEGAASTSWYAARAAAGHSDDLAVVAPLAKAVCTDAFARIAGETIQLHGGIGFTAEHDAHLFFKRAWTSALMHGDNRALRRIAYARAATVTE